jgi:hypothetical protein
MAQQEKRFFPVFGPYTVKNTVQIGDNPEKTVPAGAVPQEPPFGGAVYRNIGGPAVPPLIRGPYFNALFA